MKVFLFLGEFGMDLSQAIELLKKIVKNNSTNNSNHIDLSLVPADQVGIYEKALKVVRMAIIKGEISQEEFSNRVNLI